MCTIYYFWWCLYSHEGRFQATELTSVIIEQEMHRTSSGKLLGAGLSTPQCISGSSCWPLTGCVSPGRLVILSGFLTHDKRQSLSSRLQES